jgi:hypothetical protein
MAENDALRTVKLALSMRDEPERAVWVVWTTDRRCDRDCANRRQIQHGRLGQGGHET